MARGLDGDLAMRVAAQLSARDRLGAHLRDELGIDQHALARPLQAAWISAASFALFAAVPIVALLATPTEWRIPAIAVLSLVSLATLGAFGGRLGGAPVGRAALRVTIGGAIAMAVAAKDADVLRALAAFLSRDGRKIDPETERAIREASRAIG